jgi:small conductance mechanosensitive channel
MIYPLLAQAAPAAAAPPAPVAAQASQVFTQIQEWVTTNGLKFATNLVVALAIFVLGRWVANLVRSVIVRVLDRRKIDSTVSHFVGNLASVLILVMVLITALGQLGIPTAQFAALIAAAGLAIGLALQGNLSNFAAGFLLILFRPFKKGDYISGGGAEGVVDEIQVFSTVLTTGDNRTITVPNSKLTGDNIINFTARDSRMIALTFAVGAHMNLDKVRQALVGVAAADARVLKTPAPVVFVKELADPRVIFELRLWTPTAEYWPVYFATIEEAKRTFEREGITGPPAVQQVRLIQ